jgi:hypothetical protein
MEVRPATRRDRKRPHAVPVLVRRLPPSTGSGDYLRRFAPEVRFSARQILVDIKPQITETQSAAEVRRGRSV